MENKFDDNESEKIKMPEYFTSMPGSDLENSIVQSLKEKGLLASGRVKKMYTWKTIAAAVVTGIVLFAAGWLVAKNQNMTNMTATASNQSDYMLLLFNPVGFNEYPSHVAEYGKWMENISAQGIATEGDELAPENNFIGATEKLPGNIPVSGYFIFKNISEDKANELANNCPHLKHNGIVSLKKIIKH